MSCRAWFADEAARLSSPVLAICVGHSRGYDKGATACDGETSEWDYNIKVARELQDHLKTLGLGSIIIYTYKGEGYGTAMRNLGAKINSLKVDAAIELHFNAASPKAKGSEMLHWHSSEKGKALAECLQAEVVRAFSSKDRGAKGKKAGERGSRFLRVAECPSVIAEPFFGSNEEEWETFKDSQVKLGEALAEGFNKYYNET